jgi:hypothetical protein
MLLSTQYPDLSSRVLSACGNQTDPTRLFFDRYNSLPPTFTGQKVHFGCGIMPNLCVDVRFRPVERQHMLGASRSPKLGCGEVAVGDKLSQLDETTL